VSWPAAGIAVVTVTLLAVTLAVGRSEAVPVALALLGGEYVLVLVVDDPPLDTRAVLVGATLLVIGELSFLSLEVGSTTPGEPGAVARRVGFVAALALGALFVGSALLALADVVRAGGIAVDALGAAAAGLTVTLLWATARERGR
jgi:hypothetical protein